MGSSESRRRNERFFDAYSEFDEVLCEFCGAEEDGVLSYLNKMKEGVTEARDLIAEWDGCFLRLTSLRKRYIGLKQGGMAFDDFQGKDEDVVWMQVFRQKLEAKADPLSKYNRMDFNYPKRGGSLWDRIKAMLGL